MSLTTVPLTGPVVMPGPEPAIDFPLNCAALIAELHPGPVPEVQFKALAAPEQDGIAMAVGAAGLPVLLPKSVFAVWDARAEGPSAA